MARCVARAIELGIAVMVVVVVVAVLLTQVSAASTTAPSRIIDRTFLCSTTLFGGTRVSAVLGYAGVRDADDPSKWRSLPYVAFTKSVGVGGTASGPSPEYQGVGVPVPTGVKIAKGCLLQKTRIPLSNRGLGQGGSADPFGDVFECPVGERVQVRLRAVFRSPTELRLVRKYGSLETREPTREVRIAMRTLRGKPIAYAEAFESGRARVFAAGTCIPD